MNHLKKMRTQRNFTQKDLAKKWNCDQSLVSEIEKGVKFLNIEKLIATADLFGCTTDEILNRSGDLDQAIIARLKKINSLPEPKKKTLLKAIDMMVFGMDA